VILLLFSAAIIYTATRIITAGVDKAVLDKVSGDLALGEEILNLKYPGEWLVKEGKLYKGATLMNGNFEFVDYIGSLTGGTATIFQGDTRVATNVKLQDGSRAVNTKVSGVVADTVLKGGERYYGEAVVVDKNYQTAYEPIKDSSGQVVGIWYVGISKEITGQMIRHIYLTVIGTASLLLLVSLLAWNYFFRRMIIKPFDNMQKLMACTEQGDLTVRGEKFSDDEIGQLTDSFNRFLDKIRQMFLDRIVI